MPDMTIRARFRHNLRISNGSESGGGFSPARFFASSGPATLIIKRAGKERKSHESIDSAKTKDFSISSGVWDYLVWAFGHSAGSQSGAGRRLSRTEHSRGKFSPVTPQWRHVQYCRWLVRTRFQRDRQP